MEPDRCPRCLSYQTASILEKNAKFNCFCYDCRFKFIVFSKEREMELLRSSPTKKLEERSISIIVSNSDMSQLMRAHSPQSPNSPRSRSSPTVMELNAEAEPFFVNNFTMDRRKTQTLMRPKIPQVRHRSSFVAPVLYR